MMRRKKKIADSILIAIAVFAGLVFLFPIFWMVRSSFMGLEELYQTPPDGYDEKLQGSVTAERPAVTVS